MPNITLQLAEQYFRTLQMFANSLDEEKAMEVAYMYNPWEIGRSYNVGDFVTYGVNGVGDPQLYKVIQNHSSHADWTPDVSVSLYNAIGLGNNGYPIWSAPAGAHDAYNNGDIVSYNGMLYISTIDGNTTVPGEDIRWWSVYTE